MSKTPRPQGITKKTLREAAAAERAHARSVTQTKKAKDAKTAFDAFNNWSINLGLGTNNAMSGGTYGFNPITRIRTLLEWMYRGNWLSRVAIDQVAKDMTREGFQIKVAKESEKQGKGAKAKKNQDFAQPKKKPQVQEPDSPEVTSTDLKRIYTRLKRTQTMSSLCSVIKWARLYGGAAGYIEVYGQNPATPLRPETVPKGGYRGLIVFDRWMLEPQLNDLVDSGPEAGLPKFYRVTSDAPGLKGRMIHHSRLIRLVGVQLPYWQAIAENLWGVSIFEPLYDRMVAFDSATMGAAQLAYKAHLRTLKIKNYRSILTTGGKAYEGLVRMTELVRAGASVEGMTIIDGEDEMETQQSGALTGIGEVVQKLGEQIGGGLQIPMTKLFGQAPGGLNANGDNDVRGYYDGIKQEQTDTLLENMHVLSRVVGFSEGVDLGEEFDIEFNPLWQMSDAERGDIDKVNTESVLAVEESGNISQKQFLTELVHRGRATNTWQTSITEEDIDEASEDLPTLEELGLGGGPGEGEEAFGPGGEPEGKVGKPGGALKKALKGGGDRLWVVPDADVPEQPGSFQGMPVVVEHATGQQRWPGAPRLPAHYGYLPGVGSAEGSTEWMDCMIGPEADAPYAFVIDHHRADGTFEEHKIMLGFRTPEGAIRAHRGAYEGTGCRGHGCVQMTIPALQEWMRSERNQRRPAMGAIDLRRAA